MSEKGKIWEPKSYSLRYIDYLWAIGLSLGRLLCVVLGCIFFQIWLMLKTEQLFVSWNPVSNLKTVTGSEFVFPQVEAQEALVYSAGMRRSGGNRSLEALGQLFPT